MRLAIIATLFAALLATPSLAEPAVEISPDRIVMWGDGGGYIDEYQAERARLERSGVRVEIAGQMWSAATIYATMPNACLRREAELYFHSAASGPGGTGNRILARYFSGEALRRWNTQWSQTREWTRVSAQQFVQIEPNAKLCG